MIEVKGIDPKMIANNIEPYEPTHPGELLKDEIECRGLSQKQLADEMGVYGKGCRATFRDELSAIKKKSTKGANPFDGHSCCYLLI